MTQSGHGNNFSRVLDNEVGVAYDACMNLTERANEMKIRNANAKRAIQAKRRKDAMTNATVKGFKHPGKFPTYYKYG